MRVLVCGSRTWGDTENAWTTMDNVIRELDPVYHIIVEGEAPGADKMFALLAEMYGFDIEAYPADWATLGRSAGFRRNIQMLATLNPSGDQVFAFWDGVSKGTQHTIREARNRGIPTGVIHGHITYGASISVLRSRS